MNEPSDSLLDRISQLEKELQKKATKDTWDKLSIVATFLSSVILAGLIAVFTITYQRAEQERLKQAQHDSAVNASVQNQISREQARLHHIEVVSALIPYLSGSKATKDTQKLAIVTLKQLGSAELAVEFAVSIGGEGARSGLKAILESQSTTSNERTIIAPAYSRLLTTSKKSVDEYISAFRKNLDVATYRNSLLKAEKDLNAVSKAAMGVNDYGTSAFALINLGNVYRFQNQFDNAVKTYEKAENFAKQARRADLQFKAIIGNSRAQLIGFKAVEKASSLIERARSLASTDLDKFELIDQSAEIDICNGNYTEAVKLLDNALSIPEVTNELKFYGYLDRADAYGHLSLCENETEFSKCFDYISKAELDYQKARELSESLGWSGLSKSIDGFMNNLKIMKELLTARSKSKELN